MPPIALILSGIGEIGLPLLSRIIGHGKWEQWSAVFMQAVQGIPTAVAAIKALISGQDTGETYTNAELDSFLDHSRTFHDRIKNG
jgi:hypothetical protein